MKSKSLILLALALGCGLVATIGISQVLERNRNAAPAEEAEQVQVFVAKTEIPAGEAIKPDHLKLQSWPKSMVPSDALTKLEQLEGKKPHQKILENELMREARFTTESSRRPIPHGFRVVTIKVNAEKGVHLVNVGDKVDLQVYIRQGAVPDITTSVTRTFLRDVEIFAVGTTTKRAEEESTSGSAATVSLLVSPKQSELVTLAQRIGEVNIVLKNDDDKSVTAQGDDRGSTARELLAALGIQAPAPAVTPTPAATPTKSDGGILGMIGNLTKPSPKKSGNAKPADSGFVMIGIEGPALTQFTFADLKRPPVSQAQIGNAATAAASSLHGAKEPQDDDSDTDSSDSDTDSGKSTDEKKAADPTPEPASGQDSKDAIKADIQADIETESTESKE